MERPLPYEQFDHDADLGLRVRGGTLADLFENAARGMIELMVDPATVRPERTVELRATGDDDEMLLVAWLSEVLFAFEVDHFAPAEVKMLQAGDGTARGRLCGEVFDGARHEARSAVKAVTYHNLEIRRGEGGFEVDIVFDV